MISLIVRVVCFMFQVFLFCFRIVCVRMCVYVSECVRACVCV